jgi:hypothetical protein
MSMEIDIWQICWNYAKKLHFALQQDIFNLSANGRLDISLWQYDTVDFVITSESSFTLSNKIHGNINNFNILLIFAIL